MGWSAVWFLFDYAIHSFAAKSAVNFKAFPQRLELLCSIKLRQLWYCCLCSWEGGRAIVLRTPRSHVLLVLSPTPVAPVLLQVLIVACPDPDGSPCTGSDDLNIAGPFCWPPIKPVRYLDPLPQLVPRSLTNSLPSSITDRVPAHSTLIHRDLCLSLYILLPAVLLPAISSTKPPGWVTCLP